MHRPSIPALIAGCLLLLRVSSFAEPPAHHATVFEHFFGYFEAVMAGDVKRAASFWRPQDVATSRNQGAPGLRGMLAVDRDSPLWTFSEGIRDSTARCRFGPPFLLESGPFVGLHSLMLVVEGPAGRERKQYICESDGHGGWLLARPERLLAERGPGTPGRFVVVFERRPGAPWELPDGLVDGLDEAVAEMAARLEMPRGHLDRLQTDKLGYLLAAPSVVHYMAGASVDGVALTPTGMVVTHLNRHAPALARLVIDAWLDGSPPRVMPILHEGLAGLLGGEAERGSRELVLAGRKALAAAPLDLEDLLVPAVSGAEMKGDHRAAAAAFTGFLLETYGSGALRAACLAGAEGLSGAQGRSAEQAAHELASMFGVSTDVLLRDLAGWLERRP